MSFFSCTRQKYNKDGHHTTPRFMSNNLIFIYDLKLLIHMLYNLIFIDDILLRFIVFREILYTWYTWEVKKNIGIIYNVQDIMYNK